MITLEEIAWYLPYGLKMYDYYNDKIGLLVGLKEDKIFVKHATVWGLTYNEVDPALRPLSDITREIKHNGEKFVPIVEVAKLIFTHSGAFGEWEYVEFDEAERVHILQIQFKSNDDDISPYMQYAIPSDQDSMSWIVVKKLHEWHFWLGDQSRFEYDIIDINTLK